MHGVGRVAWLHPRIQLLLVSADDHRLWSVPRDAPVVRDHRGLEWLDALPVLVAVRCRQWDFHVDGDPLHGSNALVVPVMGKRHRSTPAITVTLSYGQLD